jgi:hypothetical protein
MRLDRLFCAAALALLVSAPPAEAQDAGPLALLLPASARTAALGNASVAGRDEYAVFQNPARLNATSGFGLTLATYGSASRALAAASASTMGPITLGWALQVVDFSGPTTPSAYPLAPATLNAGGEADQFSMVAMVSGAMTYKGFRIGTSAKYAEDLVRRNTTTLPITSQPSRGAAWLLDIGASHPLWTGTAGISLQNIGQPYLLRGTRYSVPTQLALGWSAQYAWGAFDYGFHTQVTARRNGWVSPAAGVEMGWSWIEGYNVTVRAGAHRPETADEKPLGAGLSFGADRLNLDYGALFFNGSQMGHRLTVRWR